jgi:hypothetical protein
MRMRNVVVNIDNRVDPKCAGCSNVTEDRCKVYEQPKNQWTRLLGCAARTHNKAIQVDDTFKLNPLKASKRSVGK